MGHTDYSQAFGDVTVQRNVMAFVGNGFDIQTLNDYQSRVDTRYTHFHDFLEQRHFDPNDPILKKMQRLKKEGVSDWSDVEGAVDRLLEQPGWQQQIAELSTALRKLQGQFAEFLDRVIPSTLLTDLGRDSSRNMWARESLMAFLYDLPDDAYRASRFPTYVNQELYNFVFVNFNYTSLLDDYIYLDQEQFDPLPNKREDRNCTFHNNPRGVTNAAVRPGDLSSSYVIAEVVHPHGQHSIPRSLLFGIDEPATSSNNHDPRLRLAKPFWAQTRPRYGHLFEDTALFIIFGSSLGAVDRWWWRNIAEALSQEQFSHGPSDRCPNTDHQRCTYRPELIIYWYNDPASPMTEDEVREKFFNGAGCKAAEEALIHVVLHDTGTERVWLRTNTRQRPARSGQIA
ncbi:AbiH family protein [Tessaracoccus massiliensis]|uniref:AbiH family protein n=1 Tax=Tessaracoccus massiliensis TaxID=1522311 RepID=UPI00058C3E41|nr:AbiH family protein [Tessaracoccus massiliensis]